MTCMEKAVYELVAELRKRKQYLEQVKKLAQKQQVALEKADPDEISRILEARGTIMLEVDALDSGGRTAELIQTADHYSSTKDDGSREAVIIAGEIEDLIQEIQTIDSKNLAAAHELRNDLRRSVQEVSNHRKSRERYKGEGKGISGAFVNKRR